MLVAGTEHQYQMLLDVVGVASAALGSQRPKF